MPYVSHTHTRPVHTFTYTLCYRLNPIRVSLSRYCTSRSCHCLLACFFPRSDFDHQSRETVSFRRAPVSGTISCWKSICWFIEHPPSARRNEFASKESPLDENSIRNRSFTSSTHPPPPNLTSLLHILFDVIFSVNDIIYKMFLDSV